MIKLIVGLGNPGVQYETTRHNAGFWWIDNLAIRCKTRLTEEKKFHGLVGRALINGQSVWLLEPQTFMNRSGVSVAALANFYKILPGEILVVHDELDVLAGRARLKLGGSPAGHNGLKDIAAKLGTQAFWRLRLGIDRPALTEQVVAWVLESPSRDDLTKIEDCVDRTLNAITDVIQGKFEQAIKFIHTDKPVRVHKKPLPAEGVQVNLNRYC